jgi:protein-tyrosine phosphatase
VTLLNGDKSHAGFIKNRFGSKKGLLRFYYYEALRYFGVYRALTKIDINRVTRLVFVCQGNICRSPLGEAVALAAGIPAISFGLNTRGNDPADPRAIVWAQQRGINLNSHITRRVEQYQPCLGDLLIGMEPTHIKQLQKRFSLEPVQITIATLWLKKPFAYLHDPYSANEIYFDHCEQHVNECVRALLNLMCIEQK